MSFFKKLFKGSGLTVEELATRLGLSATELINFTPSYHEFFIPKRTGGQRQILAPQPELKRIQRLILRRLLTRLRAHPHAVGFERGHSIVTNAACHVRQMVVVKMDVMDFFTNTTAARVEDYFRFIGWNREAAALLTKLCTHGGGLPQGAPTSPRLSNLVNHGLDAALTALAKTVDAAYTRYADDITISFSRDDEDEINMILSTTRLTLKDVGYTLHEHKKRRILRRHQRQKVTGLVVNAKVQLPRATRRWLRAVRHRTAQGTNPSLTAAQLHGWQALEAMIAKQRENPQA